MIDGIHFGGQVLVVALGIAEGGEKHVLGVWQGATENSWKQRKSSDASRDIKKSLC